MAFLSRTHRLTLGPLFCALAFMAHAAAASQTYQVTLLSPLTSGGSSQSLAINKAGQVVGVSTTIAGADRAFLWSPTTSNSAIGTMYALSTLNQATGINAAGEVVANSELSSEHAYLWRGGTLLKLGKLPGFANSFAFGINGFGQIVGVSTTGYAYNFENPRSFLISNGQLIDLGLLSGGSWSIARGINDAGEVYGGADTNGIFWLVAPFLYKDGLMHDMSSQLPGLITAINDAGQLAGNREVVITLSNGCRAYVPNAFLWTPSTKNGLTGTWKNLGTDGFQASEALAVNDSGAIIGSLWNRDSQTPPHAFRYHSGVMTDLNKLIPANSGITLEAATGINDAGQIIGTGLTTDGRTVSFLLTPSS